MTNVSGARRPAYLENMTRPKRWSREFFLDAVRIYRKDDLAGASAELAFRFAVAIFPFLLLLLTIGAFATNLTGGEDPAQRVVDAFGDSMPGETASFIEAQIREVSDNDSWALLALGLASTLWAATIGTLSIMKTSNRIYGIEETRSIPKRVAIALLLTVVSGGAIILTLAATIAAEIWGPDIVGFLGIGSSYSWILRLVRIPLVLLFVTAATSLIYWLAPDCKQGFRLATPGALLFAIGWAISTWLFALYVVNFGNYTATYGTLGAGLVVLFWLQLTTTLLYFGSELNALVDPNAPSKGISE